MKYFATNKAKLRGWWCLSGFVGPYKIVESDNRMFSLVTCDHQSKNSFQNKATWEHFKTYAGLYAVYFYTDSLYHQLLCGLF